MKTLFEIHMDLLAEAYLLENRDELIRIAEVIRRETGRQVLHIDVLTWIQRRETEHENGAVPEIEPGPGACACGNEFPQENT